MGKSILDNAGWNADDPRRKKREEFKQKQLDTLGEKAAREYLNRL